MSSRKKISLLHVPYNIRGGEDIHVETLSEVYSSLGMECYRFPTGNKGILTALSSLLPLPTLPELERHIHEFSPDVLHLHNPFPTLGPRFFLWARRQRIPLIATVHNHRFFCTNGLALRNNQICTKCMHTPVPWNSVLHNCNGTLVKTAYHSIAMSQIRIANLLESSVSAFIAPSPYIKNKMLEFGIPDHKIHFILHPVNAPAPTPTNPNKKFDLIFAGRLSQEKGVHLLPQIAKRLPHRNFAVLGDGPMELTLREQAKQLPNLHLIGRKSLEETNEMIAAARLGILPSVCNEILSLFALEIFMQGKRCVLGDTESAKWFPSMGLPAILAQSGSPDSFAEQIEKSLHLPELTETEKAKLQSQLGVQRFRRELQSLLDRMETRK